MSHSPIHNVIQIATVMKLLENVDENKQGIINKKGNTKYNIA